MRQDIRDRADIALLVDAFYRRAFADPVIGPIFTDVAHLDLAHHLPIFADFWETVLFRAGKYRRNALQVHLVLNAKAPLRAEHFERWLQIWTSNVDEHFEGEVAERAKLQATRIAGSMHRRVQGRSGSEFETLKTRQALEESDLLSL
ncbi:MAG: group III truncated hemoglobin [Microbacteriaceae bacterium]|jgi:hemoglobin|nr:group III truncated hemoglobin [Microbacteriaceae bacterium]HPZ33949.1 group III truncated hemoglobin [Microbacteriaceae bacterium]